MSDQTRRNDVAQTDQSKRPYEEPTLERQENLLEIVEGSVIISL